MGPGPTAPSRVGLAGASPSEWPRLIFSDSLRLVLRGPGQEVVGREGSGRLLREQGNRFPVAGMECSGTRPPYELITAELFGGRGRELCRLGGWCVSRQQECPPSVASEGTLVCSECPVVTSTALPSTSHPVQSFSLGHLCPAIQGVDPWEPHQVKVSEEKQTRGWDLKRVQGLRPDL